MFPMTDRPLRLTRGERLFVAIFIATTIAAPFCLSAALGLFR